MALFGVTSVAASPSPCWASTPKAKSACQELSMGDGPRVGVFVAWSFCDWTRSCSGGDFDFSLNDVTGHCVNLEQTSASWGL